MRKKMYIYSSQISVFNGDDRQIKLHSKKEGTFILITNLQQFYEHFSPHFHLHPTFIFIFFGIYI